MAPTFTLRLTEVPVREYTDRQAMRLRWVVESDHPGWIPPHSGMGNVNTLDHSGWGQSWASEMVAENSPYIVTRWVTDDEPHQAESWTAELKHIQHNFRIVWPALMPRVMHAKNQEDADEVERRILEGENFIRLSDCDGRSVMIGLSQVQMITYEPTEVDL